MKSTQRIVSVSDLQYPYVDKKVWKTVLAFIRDYNPTGIIINGDGHDFYDLSSHARDPARCGKLAQEIEGFKDDILKPLNDASPHATKRIYMEGNHERRLTKYLWHQAPQLSGLKGLKDAGEALGVGQFGYEYRSENQHLQLGHLLILHGHIIRRHGGWTARAHFERYGTSLLVGHSHRWGAYPVRDWRGCHIAEEQGCLCRLDPEYDPHPNWQQGFATVLLLPSGVFDLRVVRIVDRKLFLWGDKTYEI